jgi:hypothetical protein
MMITKRVMKLRSPGVAESSFDAVSVNFPRSKLQGEFIDSSGELYALY